MPTNNFSDCKYCRNLTLRALGSPSGYVHAPSRKSLVRSAQTCRLCSLIFRKDRLGRGIGIRERGLILKFEKDEEGEVSLCISHVGDEDEDELDPLRSRQRSGQKLKLGLFTGKG